MSCCWLVDAWLETDRDVRRLVGVLKLVTLEVGGADKLLVDADCTSMEELDDCWPDEEA